MIASRDTKRKRTVHHLSELVRNRRCSAEHERGRQNMRAVDLQARIAQHGARDRRDATSDRVTRQHDATDLQLGLRIDAKMQLSTASHHKSANLGCEAANLVRQHTRAGVDASVHLAAFEASLLANNSGMQIGKASQVPLCLQRLCSSR